MEYFQKKGIKLVKCNPITPERLLYPKCIQIVSKSTPSELDTRMNATKYKGPKKK